MNSRPDASASSLSKSANPSRCDLWSGKNAHTNTNETLLKVPSTFKFLDLTFHVYFTLGCHFMLEPPPVSSTFNIFPLRFTWSSWRPKRPKRPRRPAPSESEASDRSPTVAAAFEASNVRGSVGLCSCFHGSSALTTLVHFE